MLFSSDPEDRFYERLMMTAPAHRPKEQSLCTYKYRDKSLMEDKNINSEQVTYQDLILETMRAIHYPPFEKRLNNYLERSKEASMIYRNEKHRTNFEEAIRKREKADHALMAALYLLTADSCLWNAAKHYVEKSRIDFGSMKLHGIHENGYILFCGAKDLSAGTKHLCISDLADTKLVPPKIFWLLCNGMAIRRFGLAAIKNKERTTNNDPDNGKIH